MRKKDGTSVYITRDIAGAAERFDKYHFDKMIYVVASQQDLHLAQVRRLRPCRVRFGAHSPLQMRSSSRCST